MGIPVTNYPLQIVGLVPISPAREGGAERAAMRQDVQWGTPIFRAPVLPTPHQIHRELPFTANFPRRVRTRP